MAGFAFFLRNSVYSGFRLSQPRKFPTTSLSEKGTSETAPFDAQVCVPE